jgi:serine/threonine-protein kinase SRPK3
MGKTTVKLIYSDHIAQMIELLGDFPKSMLVGKFCFEIFNKKGQLRKIHKLRYWKLEDVLVEKYEFSRDQAIGIAEFMLPLIAIVPAQRFLRLTKRYSCTSSST